MKINVSEALLQDINQQIAAEALKIFRRNIEAAEEKELFFQIRSSKLSLKDRLLAYLNNTKVGITVTARSRIVTVPSEYVRDGLNLSMSLFKQTRDEAAKEHDIVIIFHSPMRIVYSRPIVQPPIAAGAVAK